ncbi:MAG TPA: hypothetical protein VG871_15560 [Vicinamibacterales bacterium]|nr:hypothetical protein [Vicinamibacterales bacterium]
MKLRAALFAIALGGLIAAPASAQWLNLKTPGVPRTPDGRVVLDAPAPRTADGTPDLSGIWEPDGTKFIRNLAADLKAGDLVFTPEGEALFDARKSGALSKEEPDANCLPQGVPKIAAAPAPWRIVQTPGAVFILYEAFTQWRQIFTDGRALPVNPNPAWFGYSTGHWDGDTLVVESTGFNGKAWLDQIGHPSSEALHVTERYHRASVGRLDLQITIDDPTMYRKPWTVVEHPRLLPDTELLEFICLENEKDNRHMVSR